MASLIDSNVVIYYLAGVPVARDAVDRAIVNGIALSVITYMEVMEGIHIDPALEWTREPFLALVDLSLVLDVSRDVAYRCSLVRSELYRRGRRVRSRSMDLLIAATALEYRLTLVTANPADYADIPDLLLEPLLLDASS